MFTCARARLFAVLSLAFILVFIQHIGMTVIAGDVMRTLQLSADQMGLLGSSYLYAYACSQFCSGLLAERFGPRRILCLMFLLASAGGALFSLTGVFSLSMLGRALNGIGMAVVMTSSFSLFSRWFAPGDYARVCALFFAVGGLGNYIGTGPLSWLNNAQGWRVSMLVIAGLTLATALLIAWLIRDWPSAEADHLAQEAGARTVGFRDLGRNLAAVAKKPDFWKLLAWFATLPAMLYAFIGLWAGMYLEDVYGLSKVQAGNLLAVGAAGFIVGNPLLAWTCEHLLKSHRLGIGLSGPIGLVCAYVLVFHTADLSLVSLYLLVLTVGMATNAPNAVAHTVARILFGPRLNGPLGGIFGFSVFIGGGCLQILIGLLIEQARTQGLTPAAVYSRAFMPFFATMLIGTVAGLTLTETYGKKHRTETS